MDSGVRGKIGSGAPSPQAMSDVEADRAIFDAQELLEEMDGDLDFVRKLVLSFSKQHPGLLSRIKAAVDSSDSGSLREASHALKGILANLRARRAAQAASRLESIGRSGDLANAAAALAMLGYELRLLDAVLGQVLERDR
jgi:HPt (histidine-containing phosphotransfer) domain-containing protein